MNICVITDNKFIYEKFQVILKHRGNLSNHFDFYYSSINKTFCNEYRESEGFLPIKLMDMDESFYARYDVFFSLHCKQLFPDRLVKKYRCINVHPGMNPYNRGWFPQVFSILNKKPIGVTIHEMDEKLDHGPIIFQEEVDIYDYDTSYDVYNRIQLKEIEMLDKYLDVLISGEYSSMPMHDEGNINYKTDFDSLCELDLEQEGTWGQFIDLLRATTFAKYDNAYFFGADGKKIYVSINLKREEE